MLPSRDLQINRKLLDSKFEGYKLDSAPLSIHSKETGGIDIVRPSDDQYSFLQQREFTLHNHLHSDPWDSNVVYIVNSDKQIVKMVFENKADCVLHGPTVVWTIPFVNSRENAQSNVTICFASLDLVVVSDGTGNLYVLSTSDRSVTESWKVLHCESVVPGIRLTDARSPSPTTLHCLYCSVDTKQTYITHLYFLNDEEGRWKLEGSSLVSGKGSVDYAALNSDCRRAVVIGQIDAKSQEFIEHETKNVKSSDEDSKEISFEWQQNFDEIKVWINTSEGSNLKVTVSSTNLLVKSPSGTTVLQGKFFRPVDDGLSVWQLIQRDNQHTLEIVLSKREEGTMWTKLFESSDFRGKEIPDLNLTNEIHNRLAHLTSETEDVGGATVLNSGQLEECDMSDGEGRLLVQYDLTSPLTTPIAKSDLGNGQWLMSGPRRKEDAPLFCLRSDVDGLVYEVADHAPRHIATLCAFGYVQASKTSRLFSFLPSETSYCGLVDADGRVFIYRGGVRPSERTAWGTQHIVPLEKKSIYGVHATGSHIFILSSDQLHLIQMHSL